MGGRALGGGWHRLLERSLDLDKTDYLDPAGSDNLKALTAWDTPKCDASRTRAATSQIPDCDAQITEKGNAHALIT